MGSAGAIFDANIAVVIRTVKTMTGITGHLRRKYQIRPGANRDTPLGRPPVREVLSMAKSACLVVPDPRIDNSVEHIGQKGHHEIYEYEYENGPGQQRKIIVPNSL